MSEVQDSQTLAHAPMLLTSVQRWMRSDCVPEKAHASIMPAPAMTIPAVEMDDVQIVIAANNPSFTNNSDLSRIRMNLEKAKTYEQETFNTDNAKKLVILTPEVIELVAMVLIAFPKLIAATAPQEVVDMIEEIKKQMNTEDPPQCDASMFVADERARIFRYGVAGGAVDPAFLAAHLGKEQNQDVREAFCVQWVENWLGPYLATRGDKFAPTLGQQPRRIFALHSAETKYARQCGRLIVDGMRDLFGRDMKLIRVEQEALTRLLEEFARALCLEDEIQKRFGYVCIERPEGVESLEHAVFLLTYHTLWLNTAMHNPAARRKAPKKEEFSKQGRTSIGFQEDLCRKMYDLVKAQEIGL